MELHFGNDFLSEVFSNTCLSDKRMTAFLKDIGRDRKKINAFFKEFSKPGEHILMDRAAYVISSGCVEKLKALIFRFFLESQKI